MEGWPWLLARVAGGVALAWGGLLLLMLMPRAISDRLQSLIGYRVIRAYLWAMLLLPVGLCLWDWALGLGVVLGLAAVAGLFIILSALAWGSVGQSSAQRPLPGGSGPRGSDQPGSPGSGDTPHRAEPGQQPFGDGNPDP